MAMANLKRISGRTRNKRPMRTCKIKREEDELKAEGRRVLRVYSSLSRFERDEQAVTRPSDSHCDSNCIALAAISGPMVRSRSPGISVVQY